MCQFKALFWKNLLFCKTHYFLTPLTIFFPLLVSCLFFFYILEYEPYFPECDHETLSIVPSHPAYILTSMACQHKEECIYDMPTYTPGYAVFENFTNNTESVMCKGASNNMMRTCFADQDRNVNYDRLTYLHLVFMGQLLYYPRTPETEHFVTLMSHMSNMVSKFEYPIEKYNDPVHRAMWKTFEELYLSAMCFKNLTERLVGFPNRTQAVEYSRNMNITVDSYPWAILELTDIGPNFKYKIITHNGRQQHESTLFLQTIVEMTAIKHLTGRISDYQLGLKRLPQKCVKQERILQGVRKSWNLAVSLGFMLFVQVVASQICEERVTGLLDYLSVFRVPKWKVQLSWFVFAFCLIAPTACLVVVFFKYAEPLYLNGTSASVMLVIMLIYALSLTFLAFAIAKYSPTAQRASLVAMALMALSYGFAEFGQLNAELGYTRSKTLMSRILCLLFSPISVQVSMLYISESEIAHDPITWKTISESPIPKDKFGSTKTCLIYLVITTVIYFWLGVGVDWLSDLFLSKWEWYNQRKNKKKENGNNIELNLEPLLTDQDQEVSIKIQHLTKKYDSKNVAVNRLSVSVIRNKITTFLGHAGSGKSSIINILTGMIPSSSGIVTIDGKDIHKEMDQIRKSMGFCPQFDIIYNHMTPMEHIEFYAELCGMKRLELQAFTTKLFRQLNIADEDKDKRCKGLSDGMKRKVSIAIALVGDPKNVILDEPTTGIDPVSRKEIWDCLLHCHGQTTILLSTCYMQEAESLGDNIAILDNGLLKCFGTPMYLKTKYGSGFFLKLAHQGEIEWEKLAQKLNTIVPLTLFSRTAVETTFSITLEAARSIRMAEMLEFLEENSGEWGVASFGISESTMEHVFFNVTANKPSDEADDSSTTVPNTQGPTNHPLLKLEVARHSGISLTIEQFKAMWRKRFKMALRNKTALLFQIVLPLIFTGLMLFFGETVTDKLAEDKIEKMDLLPRKHKIKEKLAFYSGPKDEFLDSLIKYGLGTTCLENSCAEPQRTFPAAIPAFPAGNQTKECVCSKCPRDAVNPRAPSLKIASQERLLNLGLRNITSYLLKTPEQSFLGGIEYVTIESLDSEDLSLVPEEFQRIMKSVTGRIKMHVLWTANSMLLQLPFINAYNNVILRSQLTGNKSVLDYGITFIVEEIGLLGEETIVVAEMTEYSRAFLIGLFLAIALLMPAMLILLVVIKERYSGNKHLQFSAGLNKLVYWFSYLIWDFGLYLCSLTLLVILMVWFPETYIISIWEFILVAIFYGLGVIGLVYWLSFFCDKAYAAVMIVMNVLPMIGILPIFMNVLRDQQWFPLATFLFNLCPTYFMVETVVAVDVNKRSLHPEPSLSWHVLGQRITAAALWCILMITLIFLSEVDAIAYIRSYFYNDEKEEELEKDSDVLLEEKNLHECPPERLYQTNSVVVNGLVKHFPDTDKTVLSGMTFGVRKGECFGLIGLTGAGKTTLFNILTGFDRPTKGEANILGYNIVRQHSRVTRFIGYCPQNNVLMSQLTPQEHLKMYSDIRGIREECQTEIIALLLEHLSLVPQEDDQAHHLTAVNKRKLNFAISILGFPDILFIDGMTAGLHATDRRIVWNLLLSALHIGCSALISSHSVEEIESICHRLVIMVNGQFKCIGGVQYLKDSYGNKYTLKLRLASSAQPRALLSEMQEIFEGAALVDCHKAFLELCIPAAGLRLSELFYKVHEWKDKELVLDFSVSQMLLEHVFVNMTREQI